MEIAKDIMKDAQNWKPETGSSGKSKKRRIVEVNHDF